MNRAKLSPDHDDIFDNLKNVVVTEAMKRHTWEEKVDLPSIENLQLHLRGRN